MGEQNSGRAAGLGAEGRAGTSTPGAGLPQALLPSPCKPRTAGAFTAVPSQLLLASGWHLHTLQGDSLLGFVARAAGFGSDSPSKGWAQAKEPWKDFQVIHAALSSASSACRAGWRSQSRPSMTQESRPFSQLLRLFLYWGKNFVIPSQR